MSGKEPQLTESDKFELELDEFFQDRAEYRAVQFSDKTRNQAAKERSEEDEGLCMDDKGSGCCMTGCHDCPWDYNSTSQEKMSRSGWDLL